MTAEANENVVHPPPATCPRSRPPFANLVNVYDIRNAKKLVLDKAALAKIEEVSHEDRIRYHHSPGITEQYHGEATELKKYVFLVAESANKTDIKKAVSVVSSA